MARTTCKGPYGKDVLVFTLEDLDTTRFNIPRRATGFVFIDVKGEIHFELNNLRFFVGNPLEMLLLPKRYYRQMGDALRRCSLAKSPDQLLGGGRFFFYRELAEVRPCGTALINRSETPEPAKSVRGEAFRRLNEALLRLARDLGAKRILAATDRIDPSKLASEGFLPYHPKNLWERLRLQVFWLPVWVHHFYIKTIPEDETPHLGTTTSQKAQG